LKGRESDMPDEAYWQSFFDAEIALDRLMGKPGMQGNIVEFGCGYGTFTLPAAMRTSGTIAALDIEADMVNRVRAKAAVAANIRGASETLCISSRNL
jgi:cyclopropane fatty-acyl-phospholipid synthase-like methyltransferase